MSDWLRGAGRSRFSEGIIGQSRPDKGIAELLSEAAEMKQQACTAKLSPSSLADIFFTVVMLSSRAAVPNVHNAQTHRKSWRLISGG